MKGTGVASVTLALGTGRDRGRGDNAEKQIGSDVSSAERAKVKGRGSHPYNQTWGSCTIDEGDNQNTCINFGCKHRQIFAFHSVSRQASP